MSDPPKFVLDQLDGRQVLVDLSAPGAFGDFAFRATDLATDHTDYFDAYHTGEASIFLDVLHVLVHDRPRELVLDEIDRIRADVHERTCDMTPTTISENSFDPLLDRVIGMSATPPTANGYRADQSGRLTLEPSRDALRFTFRNEPPAADDPHIGIPVGELWQFAAGMIWRSYSDTYSAAPLLTRLCTVEYEIALISVWDSVRVRPRYSRR